jgi:hypothetical protein
MVVMVMMRTWIRKMTYLMQEVQVCSGIFPKETSPVKSRQSSPKRKTSSRRRALLKKPPVYPIAAAPAPAGDGSSGDNEDMDTEEN